jgi:hypothetical protein
MKRGTTLYGVALGATLMYLFDPDRGRYRRAIVRDKAMSGMSHLDDAFEVALRDLRNRASGLAAELRASLRTGPVPDQVLVDRIRAHLGRVVSHPKAVEVAVCDSEVTLSGRVLAHEYQDLVRCARAVQGVTRVEDKLEVHDSAEHIPELQGGVLRRRIRPDILQENWAPATRLIAGATGSTLAINALRRRDPLTAVLGLVGSTLFLRALTNKSLMPATTGSRRAMEIQPPRSMAAPETAERQEGFIS